MLCFGSTSLGQLGLGGIEEDHITTPTENKYFAGNRRVKQMAPGVNHTLILLDDGTVYSCGNNDFSQLGHDGPTKKPERIVSLDAQYIVQVACGHSFSLSLNKAGHAYCWGSVSGKMDDEYYFAKPTQIKLPGDQTVVQIACGHYHIILLAEDGKVYVMGMNNFGQLGVGNKISSPQPIYLKSIHGIPVLQIACGAHHTMILTVSGNMFSFGKNDFGQLGLGDTDHKSFPVNLKSLNSLKACYVACGEDFTAVLTMDGGVFTFGAGMYGQLGHNSVEHEYLPRKVLDLMGTEVTQIACGRCHTLCYIASSGRLYSFGLNGNGQLGIGVAHVNKLTPTQVNCNLANVKNVLKPQENYQPSSNNLYAIYAGGDQSFITSTNGTDKIPAQDYRFVLFKNHILTVHIVEDLGKSLNSNLPVVKSNNSGVVMTQSQMKNLQTVFASPSCINASLLDKNSHYNTSNRYPGVDLEQARAMHSFLTKMDDQNLNELIVTQLTKLFNSLPENPPSIEALRIYVTTPFLTQFDKIKSSPDIHSLLFAYAQSINRLKKEAAGRVLDYWFAWTGVEFFKKLVVSYKKFVVHLINMQAVGSESEIIYRQNLLRSALVFLQKLNKINLEFREIVPYNAFYIPDLVDKVDIKADYVEWIKRKNIRDDAVLFCDYAFVFDARAKTLLLQTDADIQMHVALQDAWAQNIQSIFLPTIDPVNPLLTLFIRRDQIVQDTLNQLSKQKRDDLKKPLKVVFINEDAYDAGGVKKEFFMLLLREILDLKYGMFTNYEETNTIWFNDQTLEGSDMYHLIGELCGLAIYNSIIIDLPFPLALYKKLLKEQPNLQDVYSLSPSVGRSLESLLKYDGDDFESVFNLTFEITRQCFDQTINVELVPGGAKIAVTKENCKEYVNAYIDYLFNKSVEQPFDAFNKGFHYVCGSRVLELFHPSELMAMVIGNENYDFTEFEKNAEYKGEYSAEHPVIKRFWKIFHQLSLEDKKKFLVFLTGTDRIPILGMKRVKIYIQSTKGGDSYFPVAHTCFNLLDLPQYSTEEILRERLLVAIQHNQGFTIV